MQSEQVMQILTEVAAPVMSDIKMMMERERDFPSALIALLSGIGAHPGARHHMDDLLEQHWGRQWTPPNKTTPEVVIGSGPHALIYAAVRASKGVKVVLLEKSPRAGGVFACSKGPAFRLNSRNRPGPLALPGEGRGLNVLPGCVLQPSMVSGEEYQTNDEMAWVIRANLMLLGVEVHTGVEVTRIRSRRSDGSSWYNLDFKAQSTESKTMAAKRIIIATGQGAPLRFTRGDDGPPDRQVTFEEFMGHMDKPFPLQGMKRVAVLGAGDSGRTAVETLLGQGPTTGMSVSAIDFPEQIDWYGCPWPDQARYCAANQGRYSRIGKALGTRVTPLPKANIYPSAGFESVQIGPRTYDWVINCTGYPLDVPMFGGRDPVFYRVGGKNVATRVEFATGEDEVYRVGPAARLSLNDADRTVAPVLTTIPANVVSMFRYAPLTAAFADAVPKVDQR